MIVVNEEIYKNIKKKGIGMDYYREALYRPFFLDLSSSSSSSSSSPSRN